MIPLARSIFWGPMAITIMGGLFVATVLTIVVVPALYALWFRVRANESLDLSVERPRPTHRIDRGAMRIPVASESCTSRHPHFDVGTIFFPCYASKIPCYDRREFGQRNLTIQGFVRRGGAVSTQIPCIFPISGNFSGGDSFAAASQHSHLVAGCQDL